MKTHVERVKNTVELMAMHPTIRHQYVRDLLLSVLSIDKDHTVSELMAKTNLNRNTITKHLNNLVSLHEVIKTTRGMGQIRLSFYKRANLQQHTKGKEELKRVELGNTYFAFFLLENSEDRSVCIQQKEYDEYGVAKVVGSITINYESVKKFIEELHRYSAEAIKI